MRKWCFSAHIHIITINGIIHSYLLLVRTKTLKFQLSSPFHPTHFRCPCVHTNKSLLRPCGILFSLGFLLRCTPPQKEFIQSHHFPLFCLNSIIVHLLQRSRRSLVIPSKESLQVNSMYWL